jgi:hypothetical protein
MEVENDLVKYWFEDDILFNDFKGPFTMDLENIKSIVALRHQISNGEKQYYLYASAVIGNSHITMFLFNIFVKIKTPTVSLKVFTSADKAVEWLKALKRKNKDGRIGQEEFDHS